MPTTPSNGAPAPSRAADARNRAWRTAVQILAVEVLLVVLPLLSDALEGADPVRWSELLRSVVRVALSAVASWAMRYLAVPPVVATTIVVSLLGALVLVVGV